MLRTCVFAAADIVVQELSRDQSVGQYGRLFNMCKVMMERVCEATAPRC
jgi:hypothetical protein|eukprot:COSAG01_NODE_592_length_15109_cov_39.247435_8_plen_49_part_00